MPDTPCRNTTTGPSSGPSTSACRVSPSTSISMGPTLAGGRASVTSGGGECLCALGGGALAAPAGATRDAGGGNKQCTDELCVRVEVRNANHPQVTIGTAANGVLPITVTQLDANGQPVVLRTLTVSVPQA